MSVDPVIQSPTNSQSINPYSYIMNNPLSGTDPTGYASCSADDAAGCQEVAEDLGKGETADITQKQSVTGSRIKRNVKVGTMTGNGNGTVNIQIGNMSATADIGAPSTTAKRTGGVAGGYIDQQSTGRNQRLDEYGLDIDGDVAELNGTGDQGLTAFVSNLYMGRQDGTDILSGKLTKADLVNRAELYATLAPLPPIVQGAKIAIRSNYVLRGLADPKTIRFTQDSIKGSFKKGNSLKSLIDDLISGKVTANDIPPIRTFVRDGKIYSLDNRRLKAFQEAGVRVRTRPATADEIANDAFKFTSKNDGASIRVRGGL